jgi:DNA-binding GntR family transcriptional regulator
MDGAASVGPVLRRGLADEAARRIRQAIFDGRLTPGSQLREVELAAQLEVSRGPVREAMLQLEREGLVQIRWHRGAHVTMLSAEDATELYSLRDALEGLAVRRVVERATEKEIGALDALVDRMERAGSDHDLLHLDMAFHDAVYAAAGHRRLREAWEAIRSQIHLFLLNRVAVSDDYRDHVPAEHRALVASLRARDADRAAAMFAEHLHVAYRRLLAGTDGAGS